MSEGCLAKGGGVPEGLPDMVLKRVLHDPSFFKYKFDRMTEFFINLCY